MIVTCRNHLHIPFFTVTIFLVMVCFADAASFMPKAEKAESKVQEEKAQPTKTFPGIKEVVPQSMVIAARISEDDAEINKAEIGGSIYITLDASVKSLKELESQYSNWDEISSWHLNILHRAQSSYTDLRELQKKPLRVIYTKLQILEDLRINWEEEKNYWQEWQVFLSNKTDVKVPVETFSRTITSIDNLLKRINIADSELVKAQQKYSPGQEIITSRLSIIDKSLDSLRVGTFQRNAFSVFEPNYYRQFNRELFADFTDNLGVALSMPTSYIKRYSMAIWFQLISTFIITLLLISRSKKSAPIAKEWRFLYRRPLAGAVFINIVVFGIFTDFYSNMPPGWRWLLIMIMAIITMRLINAFYQQHLEKKVIRVIAVAVIITQSLQYFGFPTPLLQLYHLLLCTMAILSCWWLIRKRHEEVASQLFLIYLILGIAIVGLITTVIGFERFSTELIDATFATVIFIIFIRLTLLLIDGGIDAFMHNDWLRNRHFIQVLGLEVATRKLQILLKIIILFNAALTLLGIWRFFDTSAEARDTILNYKYTFGEFTFSVKMVLMIIIILYLTTLFSWVIQAFVDSQIMMPKKMDRGIKESLKRLIHYGLFCIGFFIAVSMAGLDLQKFTILAGALGVGIGFGMQNIVNNFVSGLILLFERPVKVGDVINVDQDWGTISKIGLRSTVVETFDRSEIIVPNADLIAQKVTNWTFSSKMVRVNLPVGVAYGSPLEKVLDILNRAALEHPEVLSQPQPNTIFESFGNSSIDFTLRFWVLSIDERRRILTEVAVIVDNMFREEGITIPFPQQDLHLRSVEDDLQTFFDAQPQKPTADIAGSSD